MFTGIPNQIKQFLNSIDNLVFSCNVIDVSDNLVGCALPRLGDDGDVTTKTNKKLDLYLSYNRVNYFTIGASFTYRSTPICDFATDPFGFSSQLVEPALQKYHWLSRSATIGYAHNNEVALIFKNRHDSTASTVMATTRPFSTICGGTINVDIRLLTENVNAATSSINDLNIMGSNDGIYFYKIHSFDYNTYSNTLASWVNKNISIPFYFQTLFVVLKLPTPYQFF